LSPRIQDVDLLIKGAPVPHLQVMQPKPGLELYVIRSRVCWHRCEVACEGPLESRLRNVLLLSV